MALIKCPECGKEISEKAPVCPNCGCPVATEKTQTDHSNGIVKSKTTLHVIIFFIVACFFLGLGYFGGRMVNRGRKTHLDWVQNRHYNRYLISETGERLAAIGIGAGEYALYGAGLGAAIGSIPGVGIVIGTEVGAVGGAVVGAIKGYVDVDAAQIRRNIGQKLGLGRPLVGEYTEYELNRLSNGKLGTELAQAIREQEGINLTDKQFVERLNPKK